MENIDILLLFNKLKNNDLEEYTSVIKSEARLNQYIYYIIWHSFMGCRNCSINAKTIPTIKYLEDNYNFKSIKSKYSKTIRIKCYHCNDNIIVSINY